MRWDRSPDLAFYQENFENLLVLNGTVSEVAVFAEELAVVGGDRDVGIPGDNVKEFFDYAVQVADRGDLALTKSVQLRLVEHLSPARARFEFAADDVVIEVFEDAVD